MVAARAAAAPPAPPDPSTLGRGKRVRTTVLGPPHTPEQPKERSMLGLGKRARAIKPSGPVKSEQSCGSASGACPHPSMLGKGKGSRTNPGCSAKPRKPAYRPAVDTVPEEGPMAGRSSRTRSQTGLVAEGTAVMDTAAGEEGSCQHREPEPQTLAGLMGVRLASAPGTEPEGQPLRATAAASGDRGPSKRSRASCAEPKGRPMQLPAAAASGGALSKQSGAACQQQVPKTLTGLRRAHAASAVGGVPSKHTDAVVGSASAGGTEPQTQPQQLQAAAMGGGAPSKRPVASVGSVGAQKKQRRPAAPAPARLTRGRSQQTRQTRSAAVLT